MGARDRRAFRLHMKLQLPLVMSLNAGFVDTAGFLALHGLFTAHVTGKLVTLGATLAQGSSGAVGCSRCPSSAS